MKIYTVYLRPEGEKTLQSAVLVPEGFSWLAIIFPLNMVAAAASRNWAFLMILLLYLVTAVAQFHSHDVNSIIVAIKLGLFPFLGVWANDLLRFTLQQRGYHMAGIVSGRNESEAQLRFFEEVTAQSYTHFHA